MRILFTHRYFWPDSPPYAAMLRTLAEHTASRGHDVEVFASQPSYGRHGRAAAREKAGGVSIRRVRTFREKGGSALLRALNVLIYCGRLFLHVLRTRPDVVTAATFPPVFAGWTASFAARLTGGAFIYHMQDVHPEVSIYADGPLGRGLPLRIMRWLDNQTLRRADTIIVLSEDMANTLRSRAVSDGLPIAVINNFQLDGFGHRSPPADLVKDAGKRRLIFAGNLGRFQNLGLLVEGIAGCLEDNFDTELLLLGDGEAKAGLQERWQDHDRILFAPFLPYPEAEALIAGADVGLVSLQRDIYRVSYPSKVLTYLGLGLPVLALVEPHSELARTVEENGLGAVPSEPTAQAIKEAAARLLAGGADRRKIAAYHETQCSRESVLALWDQLLDRLGDSRLRAR